MEDPQSTPDPILAYQTTDSTCNQGLQWRERLFTTESQHSSRRLPAKQQAISKHSHGVGRIKRDQSFCLLLPLFIRCCTTNKVVAPTQHTSCLRCSRPKQQHSRAIVCHWKLCSASTTNDEQRTMNDERQMTNDGKASCCFLP